MKKQQLFWTLALAGTLAACGTPTTGQTGANPTAMMEKPTEAAMMEKPTEAAMMEKPTEAAMMEKPTEAAMMEKPTEAAMMEKPTEAAMMEKPTEAAMMEKPTEAAMMEKPTEAAMMGDHAMAAWQKLELTDARTGETFTLGDFAGQPVYVETMATWCPNCKKQLEAVQQATTLATDAKPVFVAISVETDLDPKTLASYASDNGFDMRFAVATPEMLKELTNAFGKSIANPPVTPHLIIGADGKVGELMTGMSSAEEIAAALKQAMAK